MNAKDLFIALFVPLSWGLGFVAAKAGLGHFPPLLLMSLRFFISSILIVWFLPIPKEYLLKIFYISLVSATLQYGLTFSGLKILDTSTAALLVQTEVVFGIITAAIFLKEINGLKKFDLDLHGKLLISKRAHIILPTHKIIDATSEASKGKKKIGSTLKGIGPVSYTHLRAHET